jgi:protein involved in polysaccharide export with SLBB domain
MREINKQMKSSIQLFVLLATASGVFATAATAQSARGLLSSRDELKSAEAAASQSGGGSNALVAAAIRQRLRDGDFQVGDRVIVRIAANGTRTDTLVVTANRMLDVMSNVSIPLTGVLRSEIQDLVKTEVLKYVKAQQVMVIPLTRIGILGEVARPGYFALASDLPIAEAIMTAGGPSPTADINRSVVKRANKEFRSTDATKAAIAQGLTLDQFGLNAGDEVIVGKRRELVSPTLLGLLGVVASLVTVFVAVNH